MEILVDTPSPKSDNKGSSQKEETPKNNQKNLQHIVKCVVLFDFVATRNTEVSLKRGDVNI
jgi:hypothetical protein